MAAFLVAYVATAAIILQILRLVFASLYNSRKARIRGCGKVPVYPGKDPLGIHNAKQALDAFHNKVWPALEEDRVRIISEQENRYVSTYLLRNLGRNHIVTNDPKNIQAMLATQFKEFELGEGRIRGVHQLLGSGIFATDGEEWAHSRSMLRPHFTREHIANLALQERHVQNAMRQLPVASDNWTGEVDIQTLFFRFTIDLSTEFLFGHSINSQLEEHSFATHFEQAQNLAAQRILYEDLAFLLDTKANAHATQQVHAFVDTFVHSALHHPQPTKQHTFLDALATSTTDPLTLRYQLLSVLLAGRDTTASVLSYTVHLLARHPSVFQKLRSTVLSSFGTYAHPHDITFASLKSCKYLQAVLNESQRLYPVIPVNRRCATKDTTLPRGGGPDGLSPIFLPKGQSVIFLPHVLHRRADIWGADTAHFNPDRWDAHKHGWEFIPFGGGPRICIGQQFALTEAAYVLVRLLQRFDAIEDVFPGREMKWDLTLNSCPADKVTVRLHES
ncbi:cytochrome P450 [Aspergillus avenaceus]|uniref:Cytochrome P450 n=1 Tax=Aspergillus avenaceus TaxID=36643 RepID=A0A5N6TYL7_ASPAV|nr:cytochrome P450 [Aspergillus avenaceus]